MKESNSVIQKILATERKSLIKKIFQTIAFFGIVLTCFYLVDFFDKERMLEGILKRRLEGILERRLKGMLERRLVGIVQA